MRVQSARALDQRLEASRLDFAKGRCCANDEPYAVRVSAQDLMQQGAALPPLAWLRPESRLREDRLCAFAPDQRPHPPRRRFAVARKRKKSEAKPRRDIADRVGRALRSEPIVARKSDGEHSV